MADISKLIIENVEHNIKDVSARERISALENYSDFLGVTSTPLVDGASTNPITVNSESVTAVNGNIVTYGSKEFIFNGNVWQEFGDLSGIGALGFKNSANTTYTPVGEVSQPTTTANTSQVTVNSITNVGTLPTFTVSGETLTITAGTLPTKGSDQTVISAINSLTTTKPTFSGTQTTITVS